MVDSKFLKGAGGLFAGTFVDRLGGLVGSILIARYFGAAQLGIWATAFVTAMLASRLVDLGLPAFVQREYAAERGSEFSFASVLRISATAIVIAIAGVVVYAFSARNTVPPLLIALAVAALAQGMAQIPAGVLLGRRRILSVFVSQVLYRVLFVGCVVGVIWLHASLTTLGVLLIAAAAAQAGYLFREATPFLSPARARSVDRSWRAIMSESWALAAVSMVMITYDRVDTVIASWYVHPAEIGSYFVAYTLYGTSLLFSNAFNTMAYSETAKTSSHGLPKVRAAYPRAMAVLGGAGLVFAIGIRLFGSLAIRLIYGARLASAGPLLGILAFAIPFIFLNNLAGVTLNAIRSQRLALVAITFGLAFNVVANMVMIPRYGVVAAAWTTVATEALSFVTTNVCLYAVLHPRRSALALEPATE